MRVDIHYKDNMSLPFSTIKDTLRKLPTKREAMEYGKQFGWNSAIIMQDRFEAFWVVGKEMLSRDEAAGVLRKHFRFPLLRLERNEYGVKYCPVFDVFVASL